MMSSLQDQSLATFIEEAYRRYAVLTILDRALPDARDGLKPVQRRILLAMSLLGLSSNQPHRKSARVVGEVLGKYHPHGDASVYDAMVRMAQDFSMRYPLVDGQGNFGSIDGDSAAAMRYTEARLTELGESLLLNLKEDTVDWRANFDGSMQEPVILPARIPNLLLNGSTGIAVGMSTSILPHNLAEVSNAVIFTAKNWARRDQISVDELLKHIPGPDLPTGGILYRYRINGDTQTDMIRQAYETGNATLVCQARADIREIGGGKSEIVITELPYQVQKNTVLERIAANKDKFPGLTDVRDESDYNGMRIVFETARGADPQEVLNLLLTHTQLRSSLSYNAMALITDDEGRPMPAYMSLSDMLTAFIRHRLTVITRRSRHELQKSQARLHLVEGLLKALANIEEVIQTIRRSQTTETARTNLMKKFNLDDVQAQAILDMPLRRLAALERQKLETEKKDLTTRIAELQEILASEARRLQVVIEETQEIKDRFADARRTILVQTEEGHAANVTVSDLVVPTEPQMIFLTQSGLQRTAAKGYRDNAAIGKPTTRAVEITLQKLVAQPEDDLLLITNRGRLWMGNIGRLPEKETFAEFGLPKGEIIISMARRTEGSLLTLVTRQGSIKRTKLEDLASRAEATWGAVIGLAEGDEVLTAAVGAEGAHVLIATAGSKNESPRALRFAASDVNPQATGSARGVTAIKMLDDPLIGAAIIEPEMLQKTEIVILTAKGFAKRVALTEFSLQGRAGKGLQIYKTNLVTGNVIGIAAAQPDSLLEIYSQKSKRLRLPLADLRADTRSGRGENLCATYGDGKTLFPDDPIAGITAL
ncbi:MAG: DNA gyrase subunit A [Anaerolineales bacterium]